MATEKDFKVKNGIQVGNGLINATNGDVSLRRGGSTTNRIRITSGNIINDTNTIISGNLEVSGNFNIAGDVNQTSVTTLDVTDKTITVANNAGSAANANGAGIVVDTGTNNPQMIYTSATDEWDFNRSIDINGGSGTGLKIHSGGAIVGAKSGGDTQLMYWGGGPVYYGRSSLGGTVTGHEFRVGGTTKLNVDSSGDTVVSGNLKLTANDFLYTSGTNFDIKHTGSSQNITFHTTTSGGATSEIVRFTHNKRVGIGIASPDAPLHIEDSTSSAYGGLRVVGAGTGSGSTNVRQIADFGRTNSGSVSGVWLGGRTDETTAVIGAKTASGNIAFEVYNSGWQERMRITNAGNVGIGTASPNSYTNQTALTINGTTHARVDFETGGTLRGNIHADSASLNVDAGSNYIRFYTGNTEKMRLKSNGFLGIGTQSPLDLLHLKSTSTDARQVIDGHTGFDAELKFAENGTVKYTIGHDAASDNFVIGTTNVDTGQRLVINSAGKVGIGTTSPNALADLHVADTSDARIWLDATSGNTLELYAGSGTSIFNRSNSFLSFGVDNTEKMRINTGGNVGIGTTAPGRKLHIKDGQIKFQNTGSGGWAGLDFSMGNGTYDGYMGMLDSNGSFFIDVDSNGNDLVILQNGNVGIGTNAPAQKFHVAAGFIHVDAGYGITWDNTHERIEQSDGHLEFFVNNGEAMTLDTNGLGIGTTAPQGRLHVAQSKGSAGHLWSQVGAGNTPSIHIQNTANTANVNAALYFRNSSAEKASIGARFVNQSTGQTELRFSVTNSSGTTRERMTLSGDGTLCLGESIAPNSDASMEIKTAAPNTGVTTLRLTNAVNNKGQRIDFYDDNAARAFTLSHDNGSNIAYMGTLVNESFTFYTNSAERMRIAADGLVAIGKTSLATWSSGYKSLQIGGRGFVGAHTGSDLYVGQNASFNSGWKYEASVAASLTQHSGGKITQFVAPAGTAGNAISWNRGIDINPTGEVAIGLVPTNGIALKIGNSANNSAVTRVTNGTVHVDLTASSSGKAFLEVGTNHPLILATDAQERMQITAAGKVFIGDTTASNAQLRVKQTTNSEWAANIINQQAIAYGLSIDTTSSTALTTYNFAAYTPGNSGFFVRNSGNVGIGVSQANHLLDILKTGTGDATINIKSTTGGDPTIIFNSAAANRSGLLKFQDNGTNVGRIEYVHNGDRIDFQAGSATSATMSVANGKVGIGTTAPRATLDVRGGHSSSVNEAISFGRTDDNYRYNSIYSYNTSAGNAYLSFRIHDGGSSVAQTETMVLKPGKVGIGTSSPGSALHIQTNDSTTNSAVNSLMITNLSTGTTTTGFGGEIRFQAERNNGVNQNTGGIRSIAEVNSGTNISSGLAFDTSAVGVNSEKLRISYDGKIGGNTSSPQYPLDLRNPSDSNQVFRVYFPDSATTQIGTSRMASGATQGLFVEGQTGVRFGVSGAEHARLHSNGNFGIGTTAPGAKLDVNGAVFISPDTAGKDTIRLTTNAGNDGRILIKSDTTTTVDIQANGVSYLNGGNVGIGTTNPYSGTGVTSMTVNGANYPVVSLKRADGHIFQILGYYNHTTLNASVGWMQFDAGGVERMRINSSGKVGIGTSGQHSKLHVEGDIGQQGTTDKSVSSGVADSGVNIITGVHASYARGSGRLRVMGTENNLNVGYAEYMYTYSTSSTGHYYINLKFIDESYVNNTYARPRLYLYNSSTYNNNATNRQNTNQSANSSNSNIGQIGITNVANQYGTFQIVAEPMHWKP